YNVTIPLDLNEARKTIAHLRENNWLDLQTRAIFIDLFVYNANTNLVTLVKMITEIPAAGAAIPFLLLLTPLLLLLHEYGFS
ncbi:Polycystin cation channel, partial [Baffinella frigidus]